MTDPAVQIGKAQSGWGQDGNGSAALLSLHYRPTTPGQVEELKCIVRLVPVMLTLIVYNAIYAQASVALGTGWGAVHLHSGSGSDGGIGGSV